MASDIFRVVLCSRTEEESLILRRRVEPLLKGSGTGVVSGAGAAAPGSGQASSLSQQLGWIQFQSSPPSALVHLADKSDSTRGLIVYNCSERLGPADLESLLALRARGHRGPLLILSRVAVDPEVRTRLGRSATGYLLKPFEGSEFQGLFRKLIVCGSVEHQAHRRFATSEKVRARFARDTAPERWGEVRNLSKGGAFLAFDQQPNVRVGDPVALALELRQLRKTWEIDGRVVWITSSGCGVEFTGASQPKAPPAQF